jgi:hypothetical protein
MQITIFGIIHLKDINLLVQFDNYFQSSNDMEQDAHKKFCEENQWLMKTNFDHMLGNVHMEFDLSD